MPKTPAEEASPDPLKMLGAKAVATGLDSTIRTLDRLIARGVWPKEDMRIFKRRFWSAATVAKAKRDLMHKAAGGSVAAE
jgi:hypothetical protein